MDGAAKYYLYISDTKLNMLYEQIPPKLLKKFVTDLGLGVNVNLGVVGVGVNIKPDQSEKTRYSKLKLVNKYIEEHLPVGTVDAPQAYFKGTLSMYWCRNLDPKPPAEPREDMALFLGPFMHFTEPACLILAGSGHHMTGNENQNIQRLASFSFRTDFLRLIRDFLADEKALLLVQPRRNCPGV